MLDIIFIAAGAGILGFAQGAIVLFGGLMMALLCIAAVAAPIIVFMWITVSICRCGNSTHQTSTERSWKSSRRHSQ